MEKNGFPVRSPANHLAARCLLTALALLPPMLASAEGYGDWFLYDPARMHPSVLVEAIGLVRVMPEDPSSPAWSDGHLDVSPVTGKQRPPDNIRFPTFELRHGGFRPAAELAAADTLPASFGGYGGWVKYLVTTRRGEYVQVVVEPYRNRRVWIRPGKARGDRLLVFAELAGQKQPVEEEIDVFLLAPEVRVYAQPRRDASFHVLCRNDEVPWKENIFYPLAFTRDFVQIGRRRLSPENDLDLIDGPPLGWIRVRDQAKRLAFYLYSCTWN